MVVCDDDELFRGSAIYHEFISANPTLETKKYTTTRDKEEEKNQRKEVGYNLYDRIQYCMGTVLFEPKNQ